MFVPFAILTYKLIKRFPLIVLLMYSTDVFCNSHIEKEKEKEVEEKEASVRTYSVTAVEAPTPKTNFQNNGFFLVNKVTNHKIIKQNVNSKIYTKLYILYLNFKGD